LNAHGKVHNVIMGVIVSNVKIV